MTDIPSWARRGAKVVCVADSWTDVVWGETAPTKGSVLTIREIRGSFSSRGGLDLMFEEIVNRPLAYYDGTLECGFHHSRFRPLITRTEQQDLALFTPMLDDAPTVLERLDRIAERLDERA